VSNDSAREVGAGNVSADHDNAFQVGARDDAGQITDNPDESRLELVQDGQLAFINYRQRGNRFVLLHTEVPKAIGGHGLGGRLVRAAVDRAVREGRTVVPLCPFARTWLKAHPDVTGQATVDWGPDQDD
jgi:uncharacterized protein